ncbi:MAG: metal-sensitive transcriptional regulator [Chloroflexi bacterium]|nr:metal-sensitive transcriptional regulator [Chloroflexota bacterium]
MPTKNSRSAPRTSARGATPDARTDILKRLRRIEGQIRGIQRMIDEDRACRDVLDQLTAVQQAVRGVSGMVAQKYAMECLEKVQDDASEAQTQQTAAALVEALLRAPR